MEEKMGKMQAALASRQPAEHAKEQLPMAAHQESTQLLKQSFAPHNLGPVTQRPLVPQHGEIRRHIRLPSKVTLKAKNVRNTKVALIGSRRVLTARAPTTMPRQSAQNLKGKARGFQATGEGEDVPEQKL